MYFARGGVRVKKISSFLGYLNWLATASEKLSGFAHYAVSFSVLLVTFFALIKVQRYRAIIFGIGRSLDWAWVAWEGGLPLFLPVGLALLIRGMELTGPRADGFVNFNVWSETTPWTLIFFSLTLNAHSVRKLWPHLGEYKPSFAAILSIMSLVAIYAAFLIEWRGVQGWEPTLKCYSVAVVLTGLSIIFCSRISHIPHYIAKVQTRPNPGNGGGAKGNGRRSSDDQESFEA